MILKSYLKVICQGTFTREGYMMVDISVVAQEHLSREIYYADLRKILSLFFSCNGDVEEKEIWGCIVLDNIFDTSFVKPSL